MNPFDDKQAEFLVVVNAEQQHSLWPIFREVPEGWERVHGPVSHDEAVAWVDEHWTDLRPLSARAST